MTSPAFRCHDPEAQWIADQYDVARELERDERSTEQAHEQPPELEPSPAMRCYLKEV